VLAFHAECFHDADHWFARAATKLGAAFCLPIELTWTFYNALTTAALYLESDEKARVAARARIASAEARLRDAAHSCPENFEAPYLLVAGERARVDGRSTEADQRYERAGVVARRNGQIAIEAVVGQLGARALLGRGLTRPARGLLHDHAAALGSWGATALSRVHEPQEPNSGGGHAVSNTIRAPREQLDALTAVKVSQALSRESLAEGLTKTLIRLLLEHAGATRAVVLFANASRLEVVGSSSAGEAVTATRLPESVLRYVERMRTAVVLDHAAVDPTFGNDTYVTETRARSILCMPILVHSQLAGVVYLENDLVYGAFSPDRIALLEVIGTQLAISLENARLFAEREERAAQDARGAQRVDLYRHFMQVDFPIAVFRGPEHFIELANPAILAAWGRTADIIGLPLSVAVPELRDKGFLGLLDKGFLGLLDDVYRSGIRHDEQAVRARTPTGPGGALEDRYYSFMVAALRDASNAVEGIMLSAFDVTAQQLARQQREKDMALLAETTAQLQVVADRLSAAQRAGAIGIFEWAIPSSTMYWSPEMFALFGLAPNEIVPSIEEWTSRFVEPDRETAWTQFTAAYAARRDTYEVELRLLQPDGDTRAVRFSNRIYYDNGQPQRLIGAAVDVQSLRHAAGVERRARELAEQHVRFYELFAGILGHDLRNPLGAIMMAAEFLEHELAPAGRAALVRRIQSSGDRMERMIDQLLDFTRIRAGGGFRLSPARHDLAALCARTRDEIEGALAHTRILVSQQGDTTAEIDEDRVLQVLSNLVGNAAHHGDARVPVRVTVDGSTADGVAITVWNAGAIPADLVTHVFEPFRGTKTNRSTGLGLGLYITQQIVEAHGGTVEVRSTMEEGTSFTVRLPRIARGT
jgi:signal transduction histidine kinase